MASNPLPVEMGFRDGASSVHLSRTMMLKELRIVLDKVPADAQPPAYRTAILDDNLLGKPTRATRDRTAKRLAELYLLDPAFTSFRVFRLLWPADLRGQPMLAFLLACQRDPLLREATPLLRDIPLEQTVTPQQIADHLQQQHPGRFGPATLRSTAQNLASSWAQAGYLEGKLKKRRTRPQVTPMVTAFALLLGYLQGTRGNLLLDSPWARFLDRSTHEVAALAAEASKQGWLRYKSSGAVIEITFPGWLPSPQEQPL
jgi:hypothetical protein